MDEGNKERARELGNEFEQGRISRRDFIRMLTALGLSISATGLVADTALTGEVSKDTEVRSNYTLVVDPTLCTGCLACAVACADKFMQEIAPDKSRVTINLEYSRIRPMRFQFVDFVTVCQHCELIKWAEGSQEHPCQAVCPTGAIQTIPEGEGKPGYTGGGYMSVDRDRCLGIENCGRCLEICEEQFGSGISFDPLEGKAQVCTRCGGDPACVKACPEEEGIGAKRLASAWVIGPAGENKVWFANMVTEGARAHGRYGSGAIAGSKNLKGIVVRGTKGQKFADKKKFLQIMHNIRERESKSHFWRSYGTAGISAKESNVLGGYPIRNWQWESWADPHTVKTLSGPFMDRLSFVRKQSCPGCALHCLYPTEVTSKKPFMDQTITDMPDWEAMGMVGGNIGYLESGDMNLGDPYTGNTQDMMENAAKAQYTTWLFDNQGMDFIEGGALLGLLMELRQRDLISPADLEDIDLQWGDVESVKAIMDKVVKQKGVGGVLARGTYETAKHFSKKKGDEGIMYYSMTGKRYGQPAHGTRSNHDRNALEYVTVERPCEHTGGGSGAFMKEPIDFEGAVQGQNATAAINSMVYCIFASGFWGDEGNVDLVRAVTGWSDVSKKEFLQVGERAYALSRLFNLHALNIANPKKEWDSPEMFPRRWFEEPLPTGPYKGRAAFSGDSAKLFHQALSEYWKQRGWSADKGIPTSEKLAELGLTEVAENIASRS